MNIAITVWENRISPVFDSARTLLVASIEEGRAAKRRREPFNPAHPSRLVERFRELEVRTLICGAITRTPAVVIEGANIQLIPFICGGVDDVIEAYACGVSIVPKFLMPGCCGRRRGQENRDAIFVPDKEVKTMPGRDGTGPQGQGGRCTGKRGQGRGVRGAGASGQARGGRGNGKGRGNGGKGKGGGASNGGA